MPKNDNKSRNITKNLDHDLAPKNGVSELLLSSSDLKDIPIEEQIQKLMEFPKNMSEIRIQIIIMLLIFTELSLTQFSALLQKTKPTMLYHLDILIDKGYVIAKNQKKADKGKRGKYYRAHPSFYKFVGVSTDFLETLPLDQAEKLCLTRNKYLSSFSFKMISQLFAQVSKFYEYFVDFYEWKSKIENLTPKKKRDLLREHTSQYMIDTLTPTGYSEVKDLIFHTATHGGHYAICHINRPNWNTIFDS